ncbi:unnamed protein product [Auanema sp. JU1783]|nr:unnamed protein product [Auanema sp. JU1783]
MPPTAPVETRQSIDVEEAVDTLRKMVSDVLTPQYDTHYNLLRWLTSSDFNLAKSAHMLRKHLKWRRERKLDEHEDFHGLQRSKVAEEFAPISIVGFNRSDGDRLIVIDQAGKIDINGVMKSVQPTEYLHQMFRNFEKVYKHIQKREKEIGSQCAVYYIFDLAGLAFDPFLLSIVNGPFRVSWQLVASHYRDFIDKFIIVNSPSYINVLWSAISAFIPEHAREKFVFADKNWHEELLELCDADCLPERYGGNLPNEQVLKDPRIVPKEFYWKPRDDYPALNQLHRVSVPAGKNRILKYFIRAETKINIYSHNENDITFSLLFSTKEDMGEEDCEVVIPPIPKCGLPAMDCFDYHCENSGYYHLKLSNEASWLLPTTYRLMLHDHENSEIPAININEKWIKVGDKKRK